MRESFVITRADEDGIRVLDTRAVLAHNAHIKSRGKVADQGCAFCTTGLGAVVKTPQSKKVSEFGVFQGGGVDEKGSTSPAPDSGKPGEGDRTVSSAFEVWTKGMDAKPA